MQNYLWSMCLIGCCLLLYAPGCQKKAVQDGQPQEQAREPVQETGPLHDAGTIRDTMGSETAPEPLPEPVPESIKDAMAPDKEPQQKGYFPKEAVWYKDYSKARVHPQSTTMISKLQQAGGWGLGRMQIDFSIVVLQADATAPMRSFTKTQDFFSPDCDFTKVPVPSVGALEGESGYACKNNGDCHLIVVHNPTRQLFEMWRADIQGNTFRGGCLAVWKMDKVYGPKGRGEECTSADAAGFPIAPLLFTAEEVKAGAINHAIRFILPNNRVQRRVYTRPATHATNTTGGPGTVPYGVHFRLKADVDISKLKPGAQVVARALKKHGMFHADGGSVALTAQSDRFSKVKWAGLLGSRDLDTLKVTDFEVIDHGPQFNWQGNCVRTP